MNTIAMIIGYLVIGGIVGCLMLIASGMVQFWLGGGRKVKSAFRLMAATWVDSDGRLWTIVERRDADGQLTWDGERVIASKDMTLRTESEEER